MAVLVDANVHVIARDRRTYPTIAGKLPDWASDGQADDLLRYMQHSGVQQAVLVQPGPVYGVDHAYCLNCIDRFPTSFAAVGIVDVNGGRDALAQLRRLAERGISGVRLEYGVHNARVDTSEWLGADDTMRLLDEARRLDLSVGLPHVGMQHLAALRRVLMAYPTLPVILRRMVDVPADEGPPYSAAQPLLRLAEFHNLYLTFHNGNIESSRRGRSTPGAFWGTFVDTFGADHLMWASFYPSHKAGPLDPYRPLVDRARAELSFLPAPQCDWLFGETARQVFPSLRQNEERH
jgi:predicted TIM-barrel fold metal-dependent hydrolase